jgi:DNA-binding winged helix-turn-helix (wHTH) protein
VRFAFADCVLDLDTREVFRGTRAVALSPKAFELLELLVRERPKAVSKEKIHDTLWPGVFVSDASLSNLVAELRGALGDDAEHPRILRTVRRFGYAFIGAVEPGPAAETASRRLLWEAREIELEEGDNLLGREKGVRVWIDDPAVSRHHARIRVAGGKATLEDLKSKNGTFVNGRAVGGATPLSDGDRLQIGRAEMTYRELQRTGSTQTASRVSRPAPAPSAKGKIGRP